VIGLCRKQLIVMVPASSMRTLDIQAKRWRSKVKTIIAALVSNNRLAGPARSQTYSWRRIWENPEVKVITAFSLIAMLGVLVALYMATHFPLPEAIYAAPMTIT
jgi:hypothetical protein